jgi:pimeloyl-ACP methyl ester carboxylesterase
MQYCSSGGRRIHYQILGKDHIHPGIPWLVFLHEGLGSIAQWKDFPESISALSQLPTLVYDRYGYGHSEKLSKKRRSDFAAIAAREELPDLLKKLQIEEPIGLIGHSDGATIALMYAAANPDRVRMVVSEAAHVMLEDISRSGIKNTIKLFEETKLRDFLERYHGDRTESMFYGWAHTWISGELDHWDMKEDLMRITSPVLAIQGTDDEYGSPEQLEWIRRYCRGPVDVLLIPECGHIPHFQQREIVTTNILNYIHKHLKQ